MGIDTRTRRDATSWIVCRRAFGCRSGQCQAGGSRLLESLENQAVIAQASAVDGDVSG